MFRALVFISFLATCSAYSIINVRRLIGQNRFQTLLREVPLELTGQLDPSKSWSVKFVFGADEKDIVCPEDSSLLEIGNKCHLLITYHLDPRYSFITYCLYRTKEF